MVKIPTKYHTHCSRPPPPLQPGFVIFCGQKGSKRVEIALQHFPDVNFDVEFKVWLISILINWKQIFYGLALVMLLPKFVSDRLEVESQIGICAQLENYLHFFCSTVADKRHLRWQKHSSAVKILIENTVFPIGGRRASNHPKLTAKFQKCSNKIKVKSGINPQN